ncbi:MAG: zinc ABC transporter substrate-binding protein, partial [Oscillospiraceae bacterium]|nr:zinc ABC transporter substrate-binding protein [Oscillospiraceae bacterium]
MKKYISCVLVFVLALSLMAAGGTASAEEAAAAPKKRIVTTIFPIYDWVMNVLGEQAENAEVSMLLDNGVDLHSYQPTADDIVRISGCDLFIYVGGESDEWVRDALQEATNKNMAVINLMEALGDSVKEEELVEGMEHDHDHAHEEDHEHEEE